MIKPCCRCADNNRKNSRGEMIEGRARYSLGIYAGRYCDNCWDESGYRKEGPEGYDYMDAGEYYDSDY